MFWRCGGKARQGKEAPASGTGRRKALVTALLSSLLTQAGYCCFLECYQWVLFLPLPLPLPLLPPCLALPCLAILAFLPPPSDPRYIESKMRILFGSQGEGLSFSFVYLEANTRKMNLLRGGGGLLYLVWFFCFLSFPVH